MNNLENPEVNLLKGSFYTQKEIWGQPELWMTIYTSAKNQKASFLSFLHLIKEQGSYSIILTGAGSSAFIGLSLTGAYARNYNVPVNAVATTDLVTHPGDYLNSEKPLLLISFARSGNSPESVAAVKLADEFCTKVFHLIITCDSDGSLAQYKSKAPTFLFVLPKEANDKSLAMTGSFSGMLLAGLLFARMNEIEMLLPQIDGLRTYADLILSQAHDFEEIASLPFERVVFLGSGPLSGIATESQLKVQELSDGNVICKADTFLGFRHGPRVVIDNTTLVFLLFSNQPYVSKYETDLAISLCAGPKPLYIAGISERRLAGIALDKLFVLSPENANLDEEFLAVCYILPAQLIGFFKSLRLGLQPDQPSSSGTISRVVEGVTIYPFPSK